MSQFNQEEKIKEAKLYKIRNNQGKVTPKEKKFLRDYFADLYANKFENLPQVNHFLE